MEPGARPNQVPRWGGDSTMVQPATGVAAAGLDTGDRVPAQWLNWMFNHYGAWFDFLRGPNLENWTRVSLGTEVISESHRQFVIDTTTVETTGAAFRFAFVGESSIGVAVLRVSKTGAEWSNRTNTPISNEKITALGITTTNWVIGDDLGDIHYGVVDDGTGVGPVADNGTSWTLATSGLAQVQSFAYNGSRLFALTTSGGSYSDDDGVSWSAYSVSGTARSGDGWSAVYDGARFLFITQSSQIYASDAGASFAYKATISGTSTGTWRLSVGVSGEVVAYRYHATDTAGVFYRTTDGGATWSAITPAGPRLPVKVTCLRYASGQWLASSDDAPYLWSSNDLIAWHPLHVPVTGSAAFTVGAVAWDGGAWTAVGRSFALQSLRASDEGAATFDGDDGATTLADAGYIQGNEVSDAAPASGEVLAWNAGTGMWEPTSVLTPSFPAAATLADILSADGAGTTYSARERLMQGTAAQRNAFATPRQGDRWYIDSGAGSGEEWTYRDGAWATTHNATQLQTHPVSASAPSDRDLLEYVLSTDTWTPISPWVRKVNGGPQTTDATPTTLVAYTLAVGDYDFEVRVRARLDGAAESALWILNFTAINLAGTVTISGAAGGDVHVNGPIGDFAALEVGTSTLAVTITGTTINIVATGLAATTINWTARETVY